MGCFVFWVWGLAIGWVREGAFFGFEEEDREGRG